MINNPVICIVAFNRPDSLSRLLNSIANAIYESNDIELVISIDYKESDQKNQQTVEVAKNFEWQYGAKKIIHRERNYGLKEHILACGDMLLDECGSMIMLEDDLFVSPYFYHYSLQLLDFYKDDNLENIAGFSLYNHKFNETAGLPFEAIDDGYDNYFLQMPSSWGQMWTNEQWQKFKEWYALNNFTQYDNLPKNIQNWSDKSWKKTFSKYLKVSNRYFHYPKVSLTTNFGDIGTHHKLKNNLLQVPLRNQTYKYSFSVLTSSNSIYDMHCEILPSILKNYNHVLKDYNFIVDLYGTKDLNDEADYYLTTRELKDKTKHIFSYGYTMKPHEQNIISNINGKYINLTKVNNIKNSINNFSQIVYFLNIKNLRTLIRTILYMTKEKIF